MSLRATLKPIVLAAVFGLAGTAHAAFTTYDTAASFASVTSASLTDTFNDLPLSIDGTSLARTLGTFSYTATVTPTTGTTGFYVSASSLRDYALSTQASDDVLAFGSFGGKTVTAIGGNFYSTDLDDSLVSGADGGAVILTFVNADGAHDLLFSNITASNSFFGFTSTSAITSLAVHSANGDILTTFPTVDNLQFAAAVPEPETYALMLAGLGVVGWLGGRRARRSA